MIDPHAWRGTNALGRALVPEAKLGFSDKRGSAGASGVGAQPPAEMAWGQWAVALLEGSGGRWYPAGRPGLHAAGTGRPGVISEFSEHAFQGSGNATLCTATVITHRAGRRGDQGRARGEARCAALGDSASTLVRSKLL